MADIKKKIQSWKDAGLLSNEQGQAILDFEQSHAGNRFVTGVMVVGAISVALGVVALVASNWRLIPDTLKISFFFLFWLGLGFASYKMAEAEKTSLREMFATLFSLTFFAGVGLIAQIFNVKSGNYFGLVSLWCLSMLPLVLTMRSSFLPVVWLTSILILPITFLASTKMPLEQATQFSYPAMVVLIWMLALLLSIERLKSYFNSVVFRAWQTVSIYILTVGASIYGGIMWGKLYGISIGEPKNSGDLFRTWTLIGALGLFAIAALSARKKNSSQIYPAALISSAALVIFVPSLGIYSGLGSFSSFVGSLTPILAGLYFSIGMKVIRMFRLFCVLIGLRLLTAYFEVLGSLATTGFGLILFGILVIASVSIGRKYLFKYKFTEE